MQPPHHEIPDMIDFAAGAGATLKLLDVIRLPDNEAFWKRRFVALDKVSEWLGSVAVHAEVETHPGGIGHPMQLYHLENGARVLVKDATRGAWYGDICHSCQFFPCHDAITALWITPDGKLKRCLTQDDHYVDLVELFQARVPTDLIQETICQVLSTYSQAVFMECPWTHLIPQRSEALEYIPMADTPLTIAQGA